MTSDETPPPDAANAPAAAGTDATTEEKKTKAEKGEEKKGRKKPKKKENDEEKKTPSFPDFVRAWCAQQHQGFPRLHRTIAAWLDKKWNAATKPKRLLLLAFRGAGKSTLVGLFVAWLLAQDPKLRILALSADLALARKMVRTVKRLIESHPAITGLKPKNPELWGAEQFTVERPSLLRDPSMLARGIDGNFTGSRADVVICDDVEVPGNSDTPLKRAALREKLGEIEFVLVPDGAQLYLGTPHTYYSIYAETPREGEARPFLDGFDRQKFAVTGLDGKSVWGERFPKKAIERFKRASGPLKYQSQMMLEPVAPRQCRFDAGKVLPYAGEVELRESQGQPSLWLEGRKLVSARVWWDPAYGRTARSSRNVIAAVYQDEEGGYWLHRVHYFGFDSALAATVPEADQLCREAARFAKELEAPAITVEDNGIGKFIPSLLRKALKAIDPAIAVIAQHSKVPKDERILGAFDVTLAGGLLHAHASVCAGPFMEELREWLPEGKGGRADDGLDAVAAAILAEPRRLGPFPRAPGRYGSWRPAARIHQAETEFQP